MFPQPDNAPSSCTQFSIAAAIAPPVSGDFFSPIWPVIFREPITARASVPEAAVNKNRDLLCPKDEVWPSWQRYVAAPSGNPVQAEQLGETNFGRSIAR